MTQSAMQREFDLRLQNARPLLSVNACMALLDQREDAVLNLIELGYLRFAFDIAARASISNLKSEISNSRREVRIFRESLLDYLQGAHLQAEYYKRDEGKEWERFCRVFFAPLGTLPVLRARHLADRLNCSSTHVYELIESGAVEATNDGWKRGPNGSAFVRRASVENFLKTRRII